MNLSIYTSVYNLNKMGFDWRATLDNWTRFLNGEGQICIAVNTSEDDTLEALTKCAEELSRGAGNGVEYTIFSTSIPYSNPLFDGMIKNEALRRCTRGFCTLLDIDEVLPLSNREAWGWAITNLGRMAPDALFVRVIDLFHDEGHYKGMGQKWYLHKNRPYLKRGRVNFAARADGSTNIDKSDTCELICEDGSLAHAVGPIRTNGYHRPGETEEQRVLSEMTANLVPYVVHLGWLNKQQRIRQSAFWAPVWSARDGTKVEKPLGEDDLEKIPYYPHNLRHWNEV